MEEVRKLFLIGSRVPSKFGYIVDRESVKIGKEYYYLITEAELNMLAIKRLSEKVFRNPVDGLQYILYS